MTELLSEEAIFTITTGYRLQLEKTINTFVLLYPEGMVRLNESAAEILQLCDGKNSISHIIDLLQKKFQQTDLSSDIYEFIEDALAKGWIHEK